MIAARVDGQVTFNGADRMPTPAPGGDGRASLPAWIACAAGRRRRAARPGRAQRSPSTAWWRAATVVAALAFMPLAHADDRAQLAAGTCAALDRAVTAQPGGPLLLASYRPWPGAPPAIEGLRGVAFTYDNALATIALFACGKAASARRIADAFVVAATGDPEFHDGRVRNAYAAGLVTEGRMTLPGYWNAAAKSWSQDAYQVGTATGNVAWAALALLEAYRRTGQGPYLVTARRILDWARANTLDPMPPAAFVGGFLPGPNGPLRQGWKSTEHNVDLAAAWTALDRTQRDPQARVAASIATSFVRSRWNADEGRFEIGPDPTVTRRIATTRDSTRTSGR